MQIGKARKSPALLAPPQRCCLVKARTPRCARLVRFARSIECRATIGEVANEEHSLRLGKAGVKRWMVFAQPFAVVMNPVDHPHGGGETAEGRHPVDPWGVTLTKRTRNNKRTQVMIVSRRKK
jgi:ribosomal protein L2